MKLVKKNSRIYKILKLIAPESSGMRFSEREFEVSYTIKKNDYSEVKLKGMQFRMKLTENGLSRISTELNLLSSSLLALFLETEDGEILRLTNTIPIREMIYSDTLIWFAQNDEDLILQKSLLFGTKHSQE